MVTPSRTARAEGPLGQAVFLPKLAEAVPAASIHRKAERDPFPELWTAQKQDLGRSCFWIILFY
ncbi:hypothetical protein JF544_07320 [Halobacillus kuroshimensis]|uniref:Uncharacterized protein n=1 Tax=Halobacillus kuroshimensis TaxID=302481 RepID=A0ABS3DUP3_9BACI|nr:hypothetical protein [Halobacillus kuroshimensis]MBN8235055.1 hypothetical protein [Halobacillus kuroshimensis]